MDDYDDPARLLKDRTLSPQDVADKLGVDIESVRRLRWRERWNPQQARKEQRLSRRAEKFLKWRRVRGLA